MGLFVNQPAKSCAAIVENSSTGAAIISAVAAGSDDGCGLLGGQELPDLLAKFQALQVSLKKGRRILELWWIVLNLFQVGVFVAHEERFFNGFYLAHLAEEDNLAVELTLIFVEILFFLDIDPNRRRIDRAFCGGRPRSGLGNEYGHVWRGHAHPGVELLPAHAKFAPVFEMGAAATHGGELVAGPFVSPF